MGPREISLGNLSNVIAQNRKEDPNALKTKGKKYLPDEYVERAFASLDDAVSRTKRESAAYTRWRDNYNKEIAIKSQWMGEDELKEEASRMFKAGYAEIYKLLDGDDAPEDGASVKAIRESSIVQPELDIVNYHEDENHNVAMGNFSLQNSNTTTETVNTNIEYEYEEDE